MMGRNHIIVGACALEHAYVVNTLIEKADIAPLTAIQQAAQFYLDAGTIGTATAFTLPICLMAYFFGVLLPDIDSPDSILGRFVHIPVEHKTWLHAIYLYLVIGSLRWLHPLIAAGFGKLENTYPAAIKFHMVFAVILTVLGWIAPVSAWIFFGVFVHLFWDSLSVCGVCWFYKLFSDYKEYPGGAKVKKGHKLKLYRVGDWSEYVLVFVIVAFTVVSFMWMKG